MAISIRFTYEIFTPESVDASDAEDRGFCNEYGSPITDNSDDLKTVPDHDIELYDDSDPDLGWLLDKALQLGICYPSDSDITEHCWFMTVDNIIKDYSTNESWTYAMHIDGITLQDKKAIATMLKNGCIDYDACDTITAKY